MELTETAESLYGRQIITLYADTLALVDRLETLALQWDEETAAARIASSMFSTIVGQIDSFVQARIEMLLLEAMRAQGDASREHPI